MGFFDREVRNSMDRMFDYNRDGVLDINEQGFELDYLDQQMSEGSSSRSFDEANDYSLTELEEIAEKTGLSFTELEDMDEDEIEEALEEARDKWDNDFEDDFDEDFDEDEDW